MFMFHELRLTFVDDVCVECSAELLNVVGFDVSIVRSIFSLMPKPITIHKSHATHISLVLHLLAFLPTKSHANILSYINGGQLDELNITFLETLRFFILIRFPPPRSIFQQRTSRYQFSLKSSL